MKTIIKSARIIDPSGSHHGKLKDLSIEDGVITAIEDRLDTHGATIIDFPNLHISKGWVDVGVVFGEPGLEERETISNGLRTAGLSGFTSVALHPATYPVMDQQSLIQFVRSKATGHPVSLFPIGALTVGSKGIDLAELYDMKNSGAIAFGDYKKGITSANLLKIALQYSQTFGGIVLSFPQEHSLVGKGVANEEYTATLLGLKGIPALAEELQVQRDLAILGYAGGRLHIPTISTKGSVERIRAAKANGLEVTCSVSIQHLFFDDSVLDTFDTHFKLSPPLRTRNDIDALLEGLQDGTIDFVTTDHEPVDIEHKKVEFDHALYGTISLEAAFGALNSLVSTDLAIEKLTFAANIFQIPQYQIAPGEPAQLSLFDPDEKFVFSENNIVSSSRNCAYLNYPLKGKAYGIINNDQTMTH